MSGMGVLRVSLRALRALVGVSTMTCGTLSGIKVGKDSGQREWRFGKSVQVNPDG